MTKFLLLCLVAITLLVSGDAISAPAQNKLGQVAPAGVNDAVHADITTKRSLRGLEETLDAADEERGLPELATKLRTWVSNSKLVQAAAKQGQTLDQKLRVAKASMLIKLKVSDEVLYKFKVLPDEYFLAKGLDPKIKFNSNSASAVESNPGLAQWFAYTKSWNDLEAKAKFKIVPVA
uniref:RxLR effector protein n=1 Tax=Phytophthora sojae TaxID=67593 RepID=E0W5P7_PHYSO|nr:Avh248 [Phytophthora sojae]AEK81026.1 Avh248 [Phytophthora sojae]AEK81027.1 Avh248 [Phytophthora sojae]